MKKSIPVRQQSYRIRSKMRLCIFITLVLLLLLSILTPFWLQSSAMEPVSLRPIQVRQGDTLWSIAKQTLPKGKDIRAYISEIKDVNNLYNANIVPGQELKIPLYGKYADEL